MSTTYATLYKKTAKGAIQTWAISTENNVIVTRWGQADGKIQETRDVISEGKNLGKKNATTPKQQAEAEADARWQKQLKKGYVKDLGSAAAGAVDALIEGGVAPMLAQSFDKHGEKIEFPCYDQPKLDGHRCVAVVDKAGICTLWSRTRKPIKSMPHIVAAIEDLELTSVTFDGELYNHEYRDDFEKLTALIRPSEPREGHEIVQYHIYDLVDPDFTFEERYEELQAIMESMYSDAPLEIVETQFVNSETDLIEHFDAFRAAGYEGLMLRDSDGKYEVGKRSYGLLKMKKFDDAEFKVVGVEEGRGKLAGCAIFVCETEGGARFSAKMVGAEEGLKKFVDDPTLVVGKMVTVKYQGITNRNGVPRFPVALRLREDV